MQIFSSIVQNFCTNNLSVYVSIISKSGFIIAGHMYWGEGEGRRRVHRFGLFIGLYIWGHAFGVGLDTGGLLMRFYGILHFN